MRIVGGALAGRQIEPPSSRMTRPMMDRVREALFNILLHHDWGRGMGNVFDASHVLDAFCGTGALAFEALSRGASNATLFDTDRQALAVATKNATVLGVKQRCRIMAADALHPPRAMEPCRLIFLDPPYRKGLVQPAIEVLDQAGWIAPHALIIAATAKREHPPIPQGLSLLFSRFYGDTALHFFIR